MEKKIQDYLHLYLGCVMEKSDESGQFILTPHSFSQMLLPGTSEYIKQARPLLRPLSSMTEEEMLEYARIERPETTQVKLMGDKVWSFYDPNDGSFYKWSTHSLKHQISEQTRYLLSRGFDLFDLIPSGLAIDKSPQ